MLDVCEACRIRKQEIVEYCIEEQIPFRVCKECHYRLINLALRPLEYFNLAALHGMEGFLDDDFYNDEDGEACQPDIEVDLDESLQFPQLADIQDNLERVLDYCFVKWGFPNEVVPYLQKFEKADILVLLQKRLEYNPNLDYRAYDIAAYILGEFAGEWIENQWLTSKQKDIVIIAEAFANCLPQEKGFDMVINFLNNLSEKELREQIFALVYFKSEKSLDFIELIHSKITIVKEIYGRVAAYSQFSWPRAVKWLNFGRPLSLIALDAICECVDTSSWRQKKTVKLLEPQSIVEMNQVLDKYLAKDKVPRTRNTIAYIKANWDLILKDK